MPEEGVRELRRSQDVVDEWFDPCTLVGYDSTWASQLGDSADSSFCRTPSRLPPKKEITYWGGPMSFFYEDICEFSDEEDTSDEGEEGPYLPVRGLWSSLFFRWGGPLVLLYDKLYRIWCELTQQDLLGVDGGSGSEVEEPVEEPEGPPPVEEEIA